jgi:hypothetical protein
VQHNKRRAELHRLQEKHPEVAARIEARELGGGDTESSASEEEVGCSNYSHRDSVPQHRNAGPQAFQAREAIQDSPSGASAVTDQSFSDACISIGRP